MTVCCFNLENPMGESRKDALRVNCDRKLKLEFHGIKVTSDAGSLTYRELYESFGLTTTLLSKLSIKTASEKENLDNSR
jgi:hypothetical protein